MTVKPNSAMPLDRCAGESIVDTMVSAVGIIAPPKKPWPTRPMIIVPKVVDSPHNTEQAVKPTVQIRRNSLSPSNRSKKPASGIMTISATR